MWFQISKSVLFRQLILSIILLMHYAIYTEPSHLICSWICSKTKNSNEFCRWVVSGKSANCCVWPEIFFYWLQPGQKGIPTEFSSSNGHHAIHIRLFFHLPLTVTTNSRIKGQKHERNRHKCPFVPLKSYTQLKILAHNL